jgi:hypothetical protein
VNRFLWIGAFRGAPLLPALLTEPSICHVAAWKQLILHQVAVLSYKA